MNVYFIRAFAPPPKCGPIKIGLADNVRQRIEELQVGNPAELILIAVIQCKTRGEAAKLEKTFHKIFARQHIRGEWFNGRIQLTRELKRFSSSPFEEPGRSDIPTRIAYPTVRPDHHRTTKGVVEIGPYNKLQDGWLEAISRPTGTRGVEND